VKGKTVAPNTPMVMRTIL